MRFVQSYVNDIRTSTVFLLRALLPTDVPVLLLNHPDGPSMTRELEECYMSTYVFCSSILISNRWLALVVVLAVSLVYSISYGRSNNLLLSF